MTRGALSNQIANRNFLAPVEPLPPPPFPPPFPPLPLPPFPLPPLPFPLPLPFPESERLSPLARYPPLPM